MREQEIEQQGLKETERPSEVVQDKVEVKKMSTLDWLYLLLTVNIPILGWLVVIVGSIGKHKPIEKKKFCRAYILFKLIILIITVVALVLIFSFALDMMEQVLSQM